MKFLWIYLAGIPAFIISAPIFLSVFDNKLQKSDTKELLLLSLSSWIGTLVLLLMALVGFLMIKHDERREKDFQKGVKRKYSTSQYQRKLTQARRNIEDFPAEWEKYLKRKDLAEEEEDVEFAKNSVEFTVQLAQDALNIFDKMDINNNSRVSDTDREKMLAEAAELRQQVEQLKAKLKTH